MRILASLWQAGKSIAKGLVLRWRLAVRRNYRRTVALLRKVETRGWLKRVRQEQSTLFVPCATQQQLTEARVMKLLQPNAMGSVSDLLVCHSDDAITPSELQTLEQIIQSSRSPLKR